MSGWHDIHWGDAGTWATAIVGAVAAGAAVWQLKKQRGELKNIGSKLESLEAEERDIRLEPQRAAARQARRAQAEQVRCFAGTLVLTEPDGTDVNTSYALVQNFEGQLRNVQARFTETNAAQAGELNPNLPGPQPLGEARTAPLAVANRFEGWSFIPPPPDRVFDTAHTRVRFTTTNDVRWELTPAGALTEAPDDSW